MSALICKLTVVAVKYSKRHTTPERKNLLDVCFSLLQGTAEARQTLARAEAEAVRIVAEALKGFNVNPTQYMIALKYISTFSKVVSSANSRTVYFPYESDVVGALSIVNQD